MNRIADRNLRLRTPHRHDRREYETGTTIFEMLVATFILGVAIAGTAGLLLSASRTGLAAERRTAAASLGVEELETIRSLPFDGVGIALTDPSFTPEFRDASTVTNVGENLVEASGIVERSGVAFQVERHVTWASVDADGTRLDRAYKVVSVGVSWTDHGGRHTVWHQTGIYDDSTDR